MQCKTCGQYLTIKEIEEERFKDDCENCYWLGLQNDNELAQELKELLRTLLVEERFAYDYTGHWRFICARPEEYKKLCELVDVPVPKSVKLRCANSVPSDEGDLAAPKYQKMRNR